MLDVEISIKETIRLFESSMEMIYIAKYPSAVVTAAVGWGLLWEVSNIFKGKANITVS